MIPTLLLATTLSSPILKVRVDGDGYLRFLRDGRAVYAKEAILQVQGGKLTDAAGDGVLPTIQIGSGISDLASDLEGNIFATYGGQKAKAGQLVLAQFPESEAFRKEDVILIADDRPSLGNPGDDTFGVIRVIPGFDVPAAPQIRAASAQVGSATAQLPDAGGTPPDSLRSFPTGGASAHPGPAAPVSSGPATASHHGVKGQPIQITVQQHSTAKGDHIYLGDIAQIDGDPDLSAKLATVDLGDNPPVGVKRVIDRARILIRLRAAGYKPEQFGISVPEEAEVRRQGQTIASKDFVVTAIQALLAEGGLTGTWQSTDTFDDLEVPSGKIELKVEQVSGENTDDASVTVGIYLDGNRFNSRTVHLHLKEAVPPVQVGNAVRVFLKAGNAEVEVAGIAKTFGHLGQAVQVEVQVGNPPVKTTHTGTVTGDGTVEVKL